MEKMSYKEKFIQMNKEAKATWIVAFIIIAFWWVTGFGLADSTATILGMPLWFVLSCVGSWVLSVLLVVFLTKFVFKDFDLDDDEPVVDVSKRD